MNEWCETETLYQATGHLSHISTTTANNNLQTYLCNNFVEESLSQICNII